MAAHEKFNVNIACICAKFMFNALQSTNMFYEPSDSKNFTSTLLLMKTLFVQRKFRQVRTVYSLKLCIGN